jgi:hypothetical protein
VRTHKKILNLSFSANFVKNNSVMVVECNVGGVEHQSAPIARSMQEAI